MGVDFCPCENPTCGETFADGGGYFQCNECGHMMCQPCANRLVKEEYDDRDELVELGCPFCLGELATDSELLAFSLSRSMTTRADLLKEYRNGASRPLR